MPLKDDSDVAVTTVKTDLSPTIYPDEMTTKQIPPIGLCALSANPQEDMDITKDSGYRFGMLIYL